MDYPAHERWRDLPSGVPREQYFRFLADAISEFYLADSSNPYQQSGAVVVPSAGRTHDASS